MQNLVFLGVTVWSLFSVKYFIATLKGEVRPNKVTWLLWSIAPMIATFASLQGIGPSLSILPVFISGFIPFLIFLASFINRKAYWRMGRFDLLCACISLITLLIWGLSHNPILATALSVFSDAMAAVPTVRKAWKYPETENIYFFIGGIFSALTSYFAIIEWNFTALAFPTYLVLLNILLVTVLKVRK